LKDNTIEEYGTMTH